MSSMTRNKVAEAAERAIRLLMTELEPSQISIEEMRGPCLEEVLLDEWVCNHCGVHGDTATAIEHKEDCGYEAGRTALVLLRAVAEPEAKPAPVQGPKTAEEALVDAKVDGIMRLFDRLDRMAEPSRFADEPEAKPLGNCTRCGTPFYTREGYCGGCRP